MLGGSIAPTGGALTSANPNATRTTSMRRTVLRTPLDDLPTTSRLSVDSKPGSALGGAHPITPCGPVECT
ncbi:hypothetical protein NIIDNTM18_00760 [Mycolicibacterium litorale]|uniref:Uncharacterized protein n=1 Tax=Mycolicibacterium litorale TaxID=758802 RepID=A0A6S6P339_9MYCO|nr:hypothetical protein NIIDNTM18_00760 [Mycolicibacterium litorale]